MHCCGVIESTRTYHIQCLVHEAMMHGALSSLNRVLVLFDTVLRRLLVGCRDWLGGWRKGELLLAILGGLFFAEGTGHGAVGCIGKLATLGWLGGRARGGHLVGHLVGHILREAIGWSHARLAGFVDGGCLAVCLAAVERVGRRRARMHGRLHPGGAVVAQIQVGLGKAVV